VKYKSEIQESLLNWYGAVKRDLPWRKTQDPYKIWISEVMLQQTLVETVKGYYKRFLETFPTVQDLAESEDELLMKMWEGLGYYSRARNLKRAARMIVEEHDGIMPNNLSQIRKLPGIGPYTAGAVLSIAYGKAVPAVDGNVIRVYSRLFKIEGAVDTTPIKKVIDEIACAYVDQSDPSSYNQSLMELGATICIPKNPRCLACPVTEYCKAYAEGIQKELPKKSPKKPKKEVDLIAALIKKDDEFLILKRPPEGLLPDLWSFPSIEIENGGVSLEREIDLCLEKFSEELGQEVVFKEKLGTATHIFTHIKWSIKVLEFEWFSGMLPDFPEMKWILESDIESYAFPTAYKKAIKAGGLTQS